MMMDDVVNAVQEMLRRRDGMGEHLPLGDAVSRLEGTDAMFFKRALVQRLRSAVASHMHDELRTIAGSTEIDADTAARIARSFENSAAFDELVLEARRLLQSEVVGNSQPSGTPSQPAMEAEVMTFSCSNQDQGGGGVMVMDNTQNVLSFGDVGAPDGVVDVLRFDDVSGDEILDDDNWSAEGTDKRLLIYSLVVELLNEDEKRHMLDGTHVSRRSRFGNNESGSSSSNSEDETHAPRPLSDDEFLSTLDTISASDVMQFEKWEMVITKLTKLLSRTYDDAPLVLVTHLFAAAAGEQAAKLYLLLLQHIGQLPPDDESLGAKVTVAWRMQMELPTHWITFDSTFFETLVERTMTIMCNSHVYAAGVVDPWCSWLELWLRTPGAQNSLRSFLERNGETLVNSLQKLAATSSYALATLCMIPSLRVYEQSTEWLLHNLQPLLKQHDNPAAFNLVVSYFSHCGRPTSELLRSHTKPLQHLISGGDQKSDNNTPTPVSLVVLQILTMWIQGASHDDEKENILTQELEDLPILLDATHDLAVKSNSAITVVAFWQELVTCGLQSIRKRFCKWLLERFFEGSNTTHMNSLLQTASEVKNVFHRLVAVATGEAVQLGSMLRSTMVDMLVKFLISDETAMNELASSGELSCLCVDANVCAALTTALEENMANLIGYPVYDHAEIETVAMSLKLGPCDHIAHQQQMQMDMLSRFEVHTWVQLLGFIHRPHATIPELEKDMVRYCGYAAPGALEATEHGSMSDDVRLWGLRRCSIAAASPLIAPFFGEESSAGAALKQALEERVIIPFHTMDDEVKVSSGAEHGSSAGDVATNVTTSLHGSNDYAGGEGVGNTTDGDLTVLVDSDTPSCFIDPITMLLHNIQLQAYGVGGPRERMLPHDAMFPILRQLFDAVIPETELEDVVVNPVPQFTDRYPPSPPQPTPSSVMQRISKAAENPRDHFAAILEASIVEAAKSTNARARPTSSAPLLFRRRGLSVSVIRRLHDTFVRSHLLDEDTSSSKSASPPNEPAHTPLSRYACVTLRYAMQLCLFEEDDETDDLAGIEEHLRQLPAEETHPWFPIVMYLLLGRDTKATRRFIQQVHAERSPLHVGDLGLFTGTSPRSQALLCKASRRMTQFLEMRYPATLGVLHTSGLHPLYLLRRWCGQCFINMVDLADVCNIVLAVSVLGCDVLAAICAVAVNDAVLKYRAKHQQQGSSTTDHESSNFGPELLVKPFAEDFRLGKVWATVMELMNAV